MAHSDVAGLFSGQLYPLGEAHPLGATVYPGGVNFSIYSKNSTAMELLLFDAVNESRPAKRIRLDPKKNRTFYYWHIFVPSIGAGQLYGFRAYGPFKPKEGLRFDPSKVLIDPYGRGVVVPENYSRISAQQPGNNVATSMKSVVADNSMYDWEGDLPINRPYSQTVIYEMHVGGFTSHPNSGVSPVKRGTYSGLIEKIPYLQKLGITAVELLPVFQFDEQDAPEGLVNYWGYSPVSFFAPHSGYCSSSDPLAPLDEFRDMVKALHRAGIEVILDVVYNHTAEGGDSGPTFCFKGLENDTYYILDSDRSKYANYSGTGNTFSATNTVARRLILDSLHYWVTEMHVDGFRFDLASALSRGASGEPFSYPTTLWDIESDPKLANTKLIAEAWDAAGLYQVGSFIGDRWNEWNGKFRDDVRSFVKGDSDSVAALPSRLLASPDLYGHEKREPEQSINFVTAHDGFTLNDLVSYDEKHNLANGEGNRDGSDYNLSWNHGVEGPSDDPAIEELRNRQVKNYLAITLLALGTPMLSMGDEVRRTQGGNNNAYCQDNEVSWFDWGLLERHADIFRFTRLLINFRLNLDNADDDQGLSLNEMLEQAQLAWHGVKLNAPDWGRGSRSLALTVQHRSGTRLIHMMLNSFWEALAFELPRLPATSKDGWRRVMDTSLPTPEDFYPVGEAPDVQSVNYLVQSRSVVLLVADLS